jgi:hypothetical protein
MSGSVLNQTAPFNKQFSRIEQKIENIEAKQK